VDPGAVHVCYCHNPFRYAWTEREATVAARPVPLRLPLRVLLSRWRQWDWMAAQRVDRYVANSVLTAQRIHRYFGRDSEVLHPPVELQRFRPGPVGGYYLVVAELMAHKQIDVAVHAFNRLKAPLVVVGDGPELRRLRKLAGPTVRFTGRLSDARVAELMRSARALVVTAAEEFGIAAVESLASGRPVIALGAGGVLESVVEGETGVYYRRNDPETLAEVVSKFDPEGFDPAVCVAAAQRFDVARFRATLRAIVDEAVSADRAARPENRPATVSGLLPRRAARRAAAGW
jgi:glycosyltransferase involved in cell wall biosynthesis